MLWVFIIYFKYIIIIILIFCNETLAHYAVKITGESLTLQHDKYYYTDYKWSFWKCAEE